MTLFVDGKGMTVSSANMKLPNSFSTIPVNGKIPRVPWQSYITNRPTAEDWDRWNKLYPNGDKAVITGRASNVLVLDVDGDLESVPKGYSIPLTWTVKTKKGWHFYFKWTPELDHKVTTKVGILPKIDTRGEGGYVVFYGWTKPYWSTPLAMPPRWLVDLLPSKGGIDTSKVDSKVVTAFESIKEGNRNHTFASLAGSLRDRGYKPEEIYEFLKPKAQQLNYPLSELITTCKSMGRYEPKSGTIEAASIDDFLADVEKIDWICDQLIAKRSIVFMAGLPETGKTWATLDLAVECAKGGGLWLNKFPVKEQRVLFIDQERFKGETQRRLAAVIAGKGIRPKDLKDNLFIRCGTTTRLDLQHSYDAFKKEIGTIKPDLVIVDSFATFHTAEENNRKDIQEVLEKIKEIRNEFGCTFLFIHHENKYAFDKEGGDPSIAQMAGSIAIPAAAETVFTVRKQDAESSMIYHTKSTLSTTALPFLIKVMDMTPDKSKIKVEAY